MMIKMNKGQQAAFSNVEAWLQASNVSTTPSHKNSFMAKFEAAVKAQRVEPKKEETPVVEKPAPSEKKVEAPIPTTTEKAAKAKKIEEVNAMATFVPAPKGKDESNRSFALRLAGFGE